MLGEMFKPLRNILFIACIILFVLLFDLNNKYYRDVFKITVNDKVIYVQYYEQFRRMLIPILLDASNIVNSESNNVEPIVNEIDYRNNMTLDIREYSAHLENMEERDYYINSWDFADRFTYREEPLQKAHLIIKRVGKIIYDGDYISDISPYVNEPGRYFFQATVYRKDNFYTKITTHMSFNIIVGGGNHE